MPRPHDVDSLDCWCKPRYLEPCDECETGCWKCTRGTIEVDRERAADPNVTVIIVHNDTED